jgi:hypothetical protein
MGPAMRVSAPARVCRIEQLFKLTTPIFSMLRVEELRSWVNGERLPPFGTLKTDLFPCRIDMLLTPDSPWSPAFWRH